MNTPPLFFSLTKSIIFFCLFLIVSFNAFSQESVTERDWKDSVKRHSFGLRKSLFTGNGLLGLEFLLALPGGTVYSGERLQVNDVNIDYSYRLFKKFRVGLGYLYEMYNHKTYDPSEHTFTGNLSKGVPMVTNYYFHVFRFMLSYDFIQKEHFVLRGTLYGGPGIASGRTYQIFKGHNADRVPDPADDSNIEYEIYDGYGIGNIRTFEETYKDDVSGSAGISDFYLDAVFPIGKIHEVGVSLFARLQNPKGLGGISMLYSIKL